MSDPIAPIIEQIRRSNNFKTARDRLKPNFLNNVGEIFENHGFETTRIYLIDKKSQYAMKDQSEALLEVLEIMKTCPTIHQRRTIGRQIIKTLKAV